MNDMQIHVAADSNIGLRRRANQDSFIIDDGVFLVCDGMGGRTTPAARQVLWR